MFKAAAAVSALLTVIELTANPVSGAAKLISGTGFTVPVAVELGVSSQRQNVPLRIVAGHPRP